MENIISAIQPYLPLAGALVVVLVGLIRLAVTYRLEAFARSTVSAVYRVALHTAEELAEDGLAWMASAEGIAFRKHLAECAYDALPARIGPLPIGLVKAFISRARWCAAVEGAFAEMVELAGRLEISAS